MNTPVSVLLEAKGSDVYTVPVTATVLDAVREMIDAHIGSVVVVDGERLIGIFTERDLMVRVVGARANPATTPIGAVMTSDPVTVTPDTSIQDILEMHGGRDYRHLPVVDDGAVVGMVSVRDVVRWIAHSRGVAVP